MTTRRDTDDKLPPSKVKSLQKCGCGWSKISTPRGLNQHQRRMNCPGGGNSGPRIDQLLAREASNKTSGDRRQVEDHSPPNPSTHEFLSLSENIDNTQNPLVSERVDQPQPALEKKIKGLRSKIKWPKSCSKDEWATVNTDLMGKLEALRGTTVAKLEKVGDVIYEYGREMFGTHDGKTKEAVSIVKSRRQREIEQLVKERRQLRKQWRKAVEEEKVGLESLYSDIKQRLASLRRAESLRLQRKKKEKARAAFYKNPYRFVKGLFTKEKSGSLKIARAELEEYLRSTYMDADREERRDIPADMPPLPKPQLPFVTGPPKWSEVERAIKKARAGSAPGPNGVPYLVYKNAPGAARFLYRLMRGVWNSRKIPRAWRRAGGVMIPKEKNAVGIGQFRQINLLNVEGKIFFSVVAQRLTSYLKKNDLIDVSVQKAGIPGFSGCLEHVGVIWQQIQAAKRQGRDLHVLFLDLANAFGSVPHSLIWTAFKFFHVPEEVTALLKNYFQDLQFCITTDFTTSWQRLEMGIMAGCTISPLAFTMAMEVIIRASKWVVGGERLQDGFRLPPIRAYMDDLTTLTTTVPCTKRLLGKLQENITWARMRFKPSKSRSISIVGGKLVNKRFLIGETQIPTISEMPVKSLGRWYNESLTDKEQCRQVREDLIKGLSIIDKTPLPGRLKLWCFQFGLLPRLMWPLTVYEIPISKVEKLERVVSSFVRKWLGLPRCLTSVALYGRGTLSLPISSITEEYKSAKVRLNMTLSESQDKAVREAQPQLRTGRKWNPEEAGKEAKAALKHGDIVGFVQQGRAGIGFGESRPTWHKASPPSRRKLVVEEIRRQEEAARRVRAVAQAKQGQWTNWEGVESRRITWKELWEMEGKRLSFMIRAVYDVLPTPQNLHQWLGEDPNCAICQSPANLKHILCGCKTSLAQGRYTWRHNKVLRQLADILEQRRVKVNAEPKRSRGIPTGTAFVRAGERPMKAAAGGRACSLDKARDWKMRVDLDHRLVVPAEIIETSLRPDLIIWSSSHKTCYIVELTVPWEAAVEEAYERKSLKYADLAAQIKQNGWQVDVLPVEVGCRGFVAKSTTRLLSKMGVSGLQFRKAVRALSQAAEHSSNWLWLKRKQTEWVT